jgi:PPOX class probable F420-dependent enzyme
MTAFPTSTYVSLTTFRRTGRPVATPVWAAPDGETLVIWTRAESGKVKRLRHSARVTVAPCDFRGRVDGSAVDGVAGFVADAERAQALVALRRAYGVRFRLGYVASRLWHRITRRSGNRHELIRIHPA